MSTLVSKTGRKNILNPKKILKRHHNAAAAAISQPAMKTNKFIYYCDFFTM